MKVTMNKILCSSHVLSNITLNVDNFDDGYATLVTFRAFQGKLRRSLQWPQMPRLKSAYSQVN